MNTTNFIFTFFCCILGLSAVSDNSVQAAELVGIIKGADTSITNRKGSGCNYNGKCIPNGSTIQKTACESCTCDNGRLFCAVKDCAQPPPGCSYVRTATECCKLSCKKGCFYNDVFIPEGTTATVEPCTYGTCDAGKVYIAIADCAAPPEGCRYESNMEECCKLICEKGCFYNDLFIPEGTTATVEPCMYGTCDSGEVYIAIADCAPPPEGCRYESTMEECCKLNCEKGCYYNDVFIPEGTTATVEPCMYGTCDSGKVYIAIADCAPPPEGCRYESTIEQCCRLVCDNPPILIKEAIVA